MSDDVTEARERVLLNDLKKKPPAELLAMAEDLEVESASLLSKSELLFGILKELAERDVLYADPQHPYTLGLIGSLPSLGRREGRLATIAGSVPPPQRFPAGCRFATRCPFADRRCESEVPPLVEMGTPGHRVACFKAPLEAHVGGLAA